MTASKRPPISMIDLLRHEMAASGVDGLFVCNDGRAAESGVFTKSRNSFSKVTGLEASHAVLLILPDKLYCAVDLDHYARVAKALRAKGVDVHPAGPDASERLVQYATSRRLVFDGTMLTADEGRRWYAACDRVNSTLVFSDFFSKMIHADEPEVLERASGSLYVVNGRQPESERACARLAALRDRLSPEDVYIVADPNYVSWVTGLRCRAFEDNAVHGALLVVSSDAAMLYTRPETVAESVRGYIRPIAVRDIDSPLPDVRGRALFLTEGADALTWGRLRETYRRQLAYVDPETDVGYTARVKKSAWELDCMQSAHIEDALVMCEIFAELDERLRAGYRVTEFEFAQQLSRARCASEGCFGDSFPPIVASGASAAAPHYESALGRQRRIARNELLLVDSGGHWCTGTTDITRCFAYGPVASDILHVSTLVLKGLLELTRRRFNDETPPAALDAQARNFLKSEGLDYPHTTGHGVGFGMCVHEPLVRISSRPTLPLRPGHVVTIEPAYYQPRRFGVRWENTLKVVEVNEAGGRYGFETLTLFPYDRNAFLPSELTDEERGQINAYHARVRSTLEITCRLSPRAQMWLRSQTEPL